MSDTTPRAGRLEGAPVTVMGLGRFGGGAAAVRWLVAQGAVVTVTDRRVREDLGAAVDELSALPGPPVRWSLGGHRPEDFEGARFVVANPAVAPSDPWLERARAAGALVTSEVELFLLHAPGPVVLVTGTQGKSSTTHFLAQLLAGAGRRARAGGNIGRPLLAELDEIGADEVCVLEVSSYQLEALERPLTCTAIPAVVVTNVLEDHLERHGTRAAYAAAKARAVAALRAGGTAWLPGELLREPAFARALRSDVRVETWGGPGSTLRIEAGRFRHGDVDLGAASDLRVPGEFQRTNALVALAVAHALGAAPEALRSALPAVGGLPHRVEALGELDGRRIVDNGVSTTPDSTLAALAGSAGPLTLLVGGQPKRGLSFEPLARACADSGVRVFTFGAGAGTLHETFERSGCACGAHDRLEDAARAALAATPRGGTLLFSPAAASFDAYLNFRERALAFRRALGLLAE